MMTLGIDEIARLAAEEARREQNQTTDGFSIGRRSLLHSTSKEKVSFQLNLHLTATKSRSTENGRDAITMITYLSMLIMITVRFNEWSMTSKSYLIILISNMTLLIH